MKRLMVMVAVVVSFSSLMAEDRAATDHTNGVQPAAPAATTPGKPADLDKFKKKSEELAKRLSECVNRPAAGAATGTPAASTTTASAR